MNPSKPTLQSKMQWVNAIALVLAILKMIAESDCLMAFDWGQQASNIIVQVLAVANMIIRQFFTSQPLTMFRR